MYLSKEQRIFYALNGYLVLDQFISDDEVAGINDYHDKIWDAKPKNISVDHLDTGRRCSMSALTSEDYKGRFKINDLYVHGEAVRNVTLSEPLTRVLYELMVDKPTQINSLSIEFGTQQDMHLDSLYMTPASPFNLVGVWMALEDSRMDTGPLFYYPSSHLIPPYRFSDGGITAIKDEMPLWRDYMEKSIAEYGLKKEVFLPKKGDVLIWSSYLLHGGSPVENSKLSRRSLVSHYFPESDARRIFPGKLESQNEGYWLKKRAVFHDETRETGSKTSIKVKSPEKSRVGASIESKFRTILHHSRNLYRDLKS